MGVIYITENLYNKANGILPWRYIGSDQYNDPSYFGSSVDLMADIKKLGVQNFTKKIIEDLGEISNSELRKIESERYLCPNNVRKDETYYNKTDRYAPGCVKGSTWKHKSPRSEEHRTKIVEHRTGSVKSEATRQLMREKKIGSKASEDTKKLMSSQRTGSKNPNSLRWTVTTPTGEVHCVLGLSNWAKINNYNYRDIYHSKRGWKAIKHGIGQGGPGKNKRDYTSGN